MDRKWAGIALGVLLAVSTALVAAYGDDGAGRATVTAVRLDDGTPVPVTRTANPWQSPTPSPIRRATPTAQANRTPAPAATPDPATAATLATEDEVPASAKFVVANTDGEGALMRPEPGSGELIRGWDDGTPLVAVGPDRELSGKMWKNVRDPEGNVGWIVTDFLAPNR